MKGFKVFFMILTMSLALTSLSASSYTASYTQLDDSVLVKESLDGVLINSSELEGGLERTGDKYYFVKKIVFSDSFDKAEIRLNLDYGIIVDDQKAYPSEYRIESDGETINLIWSFDNVKAGQEVAVFVTLKDTKQSSNIFYWFLGAIILLLLLALFYRKAGKPKKEYSKIRIKKTEKEKSKDYDFLLDTEKRVIEELKKADRNELWQKQIQNSTGYSKAKVSRVIRNLEARGLVSKIPFGNTNKIRLK